MFEFKVSHVRFLGVSLLYLLYFGFYEFVSLQCAYCTYCTSAYTSSLHYGAFTAPIVLRPTRVHCTAVCLLYLLYFGLLEFIALRCAYCTYCISACMSYLEATTNQLEGYQRGRQGEAVKGRPLEGQREAVKAARELWLLTYET